VVVDGRVGQAARSAGLAAGDPVPEGAVVDRARQVDARLAEHGQAAVHSLEVLARADVADGVRRGVLRGEIGQAETVEAAHRRGNVDAPDLRLDGAILDLRRDGDRRAALELG